MISCIQKAKKGLPEADLKFFGNLKDRPEDGMSLIEIVVVIGLVAFLYGVAIPQFSAKTGVDAASKIQRLAADIRNAYDLAILTNKYYRLVFNLSSGEYFLEETDASSIKFSDKNRPHDMTEQEEKDEIQAAEEKFKEYESLAGQVFKDPTDDKDIPPTSPVIAAKSRLELPKWRKVTMLEWEGRSLGPYMMISEMQAEHHQDRQLLSDLADQGRAMLYFMPGGYVEKAYFRIVYRDGSGQPDETQPPYTVSTNPTEGTADVIGGIQEVNVHEVDQS